MVQTRLFLVHVAIVHITMKSRVIIIGSAYFPPEGQEPIYSRVGRTLIDHCKSHKIHIIIVCDANAHHKVWGSSDTNEKGECLLEFIMTNKLEMMNQGNVATYRHEGLERQEVINLTLVSTFFKSKL
jgi:Endonuclease-reverse transcriptase